LLLLRKLNIKGDSGQSTIDPNDGAAAGLVFASSEVQAGGDGFRPAGALTNPSSVPTVACRLSDDDHQTSVTLANLVFRWTTSFAGDDQSRASTSARPDRTAAQMIAEHSLLDTATASAEPIGATGVWPLSLLNHEQASVTLACLVLEGH
jgi:hypothetical protein